MGFGVVEPFGVLRVAFQSGVFCLENLVKLLYGTDEDVIDIRGPDFDRYLCLGFTWQLK